MEETQNQYEIGIRDLSRNYHYEEKDIARQTSDVQSFELDLANINNHFRSLNNPITKHSSLLETLAISIPASLALALLFTPQDSKYLPYFGVVAVISCFLNAHYLIQKDRTY